MVISTECPETHEGRRLHVGVESISYGDGGPRWEWPFIVAAVDAAPVAEVVSIREVIDENDPFGAVKGVEIDVVTLAGAADTLVFDY